MRTPPRSVLLGLLLLPVLAGLATASPKPALGFQVYAAPDSLAGAGASGEPSVGVSWPTGRVLFRANDRTFAISLSKARRATWSLSHLDELPNVDPILYTHSPSGRTWSGGLLGPCSAILTSTDDRTWTPTTDNCAGVDHETVGAGPVRAPLPANPLSPLVVYYCAHAVEDFCAVSLDGGLTYGPEVPTGAACLGGHGHVKVAADGAAYLPSARCSPVTSPTSSGSMPGGAVTLDNGTTWQSYVIGQQEASSGFGFDPSVATTPDGTVYEAWVGPAGHPVVASSHDQGLTWGTVRDLTRQGAPVNAVFPAAVAGRDKRVAVAYLGSRTPGDAHTAKWHGTWDLYVSQSLDGGRTWSTTRVTKDPVQRGFVCTAGAGCASNRNLLDFMDASLTKDGRVVVGFADGCVGTCAGRHGTEKESTGALATIAVQWDGPRLR